MSPKKIPALIAEVASGDPSVSGAAGRELLNRYDECTEHLGALLDLMQAENAASASYGRLIFQRLGERGVPALTAEYERTSGQHQRRVLELLCNLSSFDVCYPLLKRGIEGNEEELQFYSAVLLGQQYNPDEVWSDDAKQTLNKAIEILLASRSNQDRWFGIRVTLRHLGLLDSS